MLIPCPGHVPPLNPAPPPAPSGHAPGHSAHVHSCPREGMSPPPPAHPRPAPLRAWTSPARRRPARTNSGQRSPPRSGPGQHTAWKRLKPGPTALAALAGVGCGRRRLSVAELIGAFFTARATPVIALGSTFIDFTPPWLKDFAIATFGTNDKVALFVGMGRDHPAARLRAGRRGVPEVGPRRRRGAADGRGDRGGVVTRASVKPLDAVPTLIGTVAGLMRCGSWSPGCGGCSLGRTPGRPRPRRTGTPRYHPARLLRRTGVTAAAAAIAATGGRLLSAARSNVAQARESLRLPAPAKAPAAVPAGVQSAAPGVTPWLTPNGDFYRIDTALSVPEINAEDWELRVHGLVEQEVRLTFQDLLDADLIESHVSLTCVSNPVGGNLAGNAKWLGLPIRDVLKMARPKEGADMVLSTSIDGFSASTPLEVLQDDRDAMLAIGMNGEPLPLEHGYPVRMVVPGLYGFVSATKWVVDLEVTRFADSKAYWTQRGWSERGPIKTMARVEVPKSFAKVRPGGSQSAAPRGPRPAASPRSRCRSTTAPGPRPCSPTRPPSSHGGSGPSTGMPPRARTTSRPAPPTEPARSRRTSARIRCPTAPPAGSRSW